MNIRPGARLRIRMVNVSNARVIPLKVSGFSAEVYSIDSTPCQPFDPLKRTVIIAPASRIEMALQAPYEADKDGAIEVKLGQGIPIFTYRTAGDPLPAKLKLAALPDPGLPPAIRLQDAMRVDLAITGGVGPDQAESETAALDRRFPDPRRIFTLNGGALGGFAGKPLVSLRRDKVLVLALMNKTSWPQVIALHGHAFRLLHPFDDGWEPYFLDTLYLAPNTTARIALIASNPGKWAVRSTIAEHFATGVSTWFEVT
jgi:FtsP/CotA-like multicopper oxidase with cupredoxin domain